MLSIELSYNDLVDLKAALPAGSVTRQPAGRTSPFRHGDLGLIVAVVLLTPPVIHALAVWLAKRRVFESEEESLTIEKGPDGTLRLTMHKYTTGTTSAPPSPAVVEALQAQLAQLAEQLTQK